MQIAQLLTEMPKQPMSFSFLCKCSSTDQYILTMETEWISRANQMDALQSSAIHT